MYRRILISGLGSIGSFVAQGLSYFQDLEKLVIIDPDLVEEHNVSKSIYSSKYVGKNKALALKNILSQTTEAEIEAHQIKYSESNFTSNDIDLIIDCRDILCDRNIDSLKIFISGRSLIIDGRKVKYGRTIPGEYTSEINVMDLMNISYIVTKVIETDLVKYLIRNNDLIQIPLDAERSDIEKRLSKIYNRDKTDIIYDLVERTRISNIDDVVREISNMSESNRMEIMLDTENGSETFLLNKGNFNSIYEVIDFISSLIKYEPHESFLVSIEGQRIILTPEIGAA